MNSCKYFRGLCGVGRCVRRAVRSPLTSLSNSYCCRRALAAGQRTRRVEQLVLLPIGAVNSLVLLLARGFFFVWDRLLFLLMRINSCYGAWPLRTLQFKVAVLRGWEVHSVLSFVRVGQGSTRLQDFSKLGRCAIPGHRHLYFSLR